MYFVVYKDKAGEWRWSLHAANHKKVADSGESYQNKTDCISGVNLVKGTNALTPVKEA